MTPEERSRTIREIREYVRGTGSDHHNSIENLRACSDEELESRLAWFRNESRNKWRGR